MAFPDNLDALDTNQEWVDGTTIVEASYLNNIQTAIDAVQVKLGVDESAVTTSHDYLIANKGAQADGTTSLTPTIASANTWQDLDLSAYVGAKSCLVFLEVKDSAGYILYFKPKGFGSTPPNTTHSANSNAAGLGVFDTLANQYVYTAMFTSSAGVIQIACSATGSTLTIKIIGFIG